MLRPYEQSCVCGGSHEYCDGMTWACDSCGCGGCEGLDDREREEGRLVFMGLDDGL